MSKMEEDLEQDFQDEQDMSRIYKIYKIFRMSFRPNRSAGACPPQQDVLLPSEQDQAILLYREGCMAVGEPSRVSMLSVIPTLARDRPSPYGIKGDAAAP